MDAADYLAVLIVSDAVARRRASTPPIFSLDDYKETLGEHHQIWIADNGEQALRTAFERLSSIGVLKPVITPHASRRFRADDVNTFMLQEGQGPFGGGLREAVDLFSALGKGWLIESLRNALDGRYVDEAWSSSVESAWSPLKLERPDETLDHLSNELEALAELVRSDNGYAHDDTGERDDVLTRLNAGAGYLRSASVFTSTALTIHVIWPLERLIARFGPAAIGAASKVALDLFTDWLKKAVGVS